MKVYFDNQIFLIQRVGGVSRYFYNLKKALIENKLCKVDNWAFIYRNYYLGKGNGAIFLRPLGLKKIDKLAGSSTALRYMGKINELIAFHRLRNSDRDLIHVTADDSEYLKGANLKKPIVATVHDLIAELYPSDFPDIKNWLKQRKNTFKRADHLICISESTKRDLKDIYGISEDKISMVYHGPPDYMVEGEKFNLLNSKTEQPQRYLLYIGDRKTPYKNFWKMIENLVPILDGNDELKLLCVGSPFTQLEQDGLNKFGLRNAVKSVQALDQELFSIYQNAACLILPSVYEGFGFPLLEAMKAGCPILASSSSSLPEVGGNGALYFDPASFNNFTHQLKMILSNGELKKELLKHQPKVLERFSWKITAEQTYKVYSNLS
ncbi:glycosyltransferase involved in cell wall biosynthesis [Mucilaginibacter frigoritolerans]|uniref:Glycosyltransferase involved in cell wall biosynthesis n=1 Tax=Mucilaginibacter frigoritolerans TaxID=652788 RepID=A0A562U672_9SPHI|nr:glycosyltransferase family 1 protein [Mucilaginibacter frigoritolerans]TWJ00641.1 glycosyltransferase involved in cell wall biosynthesis [Mucilaginibacter frigoritolerans]